MPSFLHFLSSKLLFFRKTGKIPSPPLKFLKSYTDLPEKTLPNCHVDPSPSCILSRSQKKTDSSSVHNVASCKFSVSSVFLWFWLYSTAPPAPPNKHGLCPCVETRVVLLTIDSLTDHLICACDLNDLASPACVSGPSPAQRAPISVATSVNKRRMAVASDKSLSARRFQQSH